MQLKAETKWLCEHAQQLERFSGQWVVFNVNEGVVESGFSLKQILKSSRVAKKTEKPFVFHVPSREELAQPFLTARKR